jgi:hypothetical protein
MFTTTALRKFSRVMNGLGLRKMRLARSFAFTIWRLPSLSSYSLSGSPDTVSLRIFTQAQTMLMVIAFVGVILTPALVALPPTVISTSTYSPFFGSS